MKKRRMAAMLVVLTAAIMFYWGFGCRAQAAEGTDKKQEIIYKDGVIQFRGLTAGEITRINTKGILGSALDKYVIRDNIDLLSYVIEVVNDGMNPISDVMRFEVDESYFNEETGLYCVPAAELNLKEGTNKVTLAYFVDVELTRADVPGAEDNHLQFRCYGYEGGGSISLSVEIGSGGTSDEDTSPAGYEDDVTDMVAAAESGSTVELKGITAISINLMRELRERGDVALRMEYTYEGVDYVVSIPAGKAVVADDIPWYGPLWLAQHYGSGAASAGAAASSYTVQPGDTLGRIARDNDMTVAELAAKNPQISDVNRIRSGQSLNLR